jgi:hypothetical protein
MGNSLAVVVHAANIHDAKSGIHPAKKTFEKYPTIERFCVEILGLGVDISKKIKPHEWEKLPWRWIEGRTFASLRHSRPLFKDYEPCLGSLETIVQISPLHILLRRW